MRKAVYLAALLPFSSLAACSSGGSETAAGGGSGSGTGSESSAVTQTRMDDIDKIEGTISDEMIDTSSSTDDAPLAGVGNSAGTANAPKADAKTAPVKPQPANDAAAANDAAE